MKNQKYIDFHMHTRFSDGELTPQNLVSCMAARGMDIIAISDHDNFRAYFEARNTSEKYGLVLLPAAEITTPDYHLLSIGFNPMDKKTQEFIDYASKVQERGTVKKVEVLRQHGVPITMDKLHAEFPLARLGKGNLQAVLYSDPECREYMARNHPEFSPQDIFHHYLGKNGIAKRTWDKEAISPKEAIEGIHAAGGIIGIAHAPKDVIEISELEELVRLGIDFLEIQPNARKLPAKGSVSYEVVEEFAKSKGLPLTYGSDYHGPNFDRPFLKRTENVLSEGLANLLNNCSGVSQKV